MKSRKTLMCTAWATSAVKSTRTSEKMKRAMSVQSKQSHAIKRQWILTTQQSLIKVRSPGGLQVVDCACVRWGQTRRVSFQSS